MKWMELVLLVTLILGTSIAAVLVGLAIYAWTH